MNEFLKPDNHIKETQVKSNATQLLSLSAIALALNGAVFQASAQTAAKDAEPVTLAANAAVLKKLPIL